MRTTVDHISPRILPKGSRQILRSTWGKHTPNKAISSIPKCMPTTGLPTIPVEMVKPVKDDPTLKDVTRCLAYTIPMLQAVFWENVNLTLDTLAGMRRTETKALSRSLRELNSVSIKKRMKFGSYEHWESNKERFLDKEGDAPLSALWKEVRTLFEQFGEVDSYTDAEGTYHKGNLDLCTHAYTAILLYRKTYELDKVVKVEYEKRLKGWKISIPQEETEAYGHLMLLFERFIYPVKESNPYYDGYPQLTEGITKALDAVQATIEELEYKMA